MVKDGLKNFFLNYLANFIFRGSFIMTSELLECENFIKNYKIEKKIGSGGMGDVFLAIDKRLDRYVAVKTLKLSSENDKGNSEFIQRFKREAKAIARLSHQNIVSIYDIGEENSQYYMVMEYIEGHSLEKFIKNSTIINFDLAVIILLQLCSALDYSHNNNIIHRDIKPANIILTKENSVKLTDFGIAHFSTDNQKITKVDGSILGSIAYISPEQLVNPGSIDNRTDIYLLGSSIYELMTGKLLFETDNIGLLVNKIISEKPVPISDINPQIPKDFSDIIDKCLEKDPEKRYNNAREIIKDASKFISKENLFGVPVSNTMSEKININDSNDNIDNNTNKKISLNMIKRTPSLSTTNKKIIDYFSSNKYLWVNLLSNNFETIENKDSLSKIKSTIKEKDLKGNSFSGIIVLNDNIFLLVYEGYFTAALNTVKIMRGDKVFETLPLLKQDITLKALPKENKEIALLMSNIINLNGENVYCDLDSALVDLSNLLEELTSQEEQKFTGYIVLSNISNTEDNSEKIYIYAYLENKSLFSFIIGKNNISQLINTPIEDLLKDGHFLVNIYKPKFEPMDNDLILLLEKSEIIIKYNDLKDPKLEDILQFESNKIPDLVIDALKENIRFDVKSYLDTKINFLGKSISVLDYINRINLYRFCNFLCIDFYLKINVSNNINMLKNTYLNINLIRKFRFNQNIQTKNGVDFTFSWIAYDDNDDILFLGNFGEPDEIYMKSFISACISLKEENKANKLFSAFYISKSISNSIIECYNKNTINKGFFVKEKGIVKTVNNKNFQLILIEEKIDTFELVLPN